MEPSTKMTTLVLVIEHNFVMKNHTIKIIEVLFETRDHIFGGRVSLPKTIPVANIPKKLKAS